MFFLSLSLSLNRFVHLNEIEYLYNEEKNEEQNRKNSGYFIILFVYMTLNLSNTVNREVSKIENEMNSIEFYPD